MKLRTVIRCTPETRNVGPASLPTIPPTAPCETRSGSAALLCAVLVAGRIAISLSTQTSIVPTTMAAAARDVEVEIERPAEDRKEQILRHQAAIASLLDDWMAEIEREKLQLQQAKGPSRVTDGRQP